MSTTYYTHKEWLDLSLEEKREVEKKQLFLHLDKAGVEAATFLLHRIAEGKIDGAFYWDAHSSDCGCILGTLAYSVSGFDAFAADTTDTHEWDSKFITSDLRVSENCSVVEVLAYNIRPDDTPENNENARILHDWTKEWIEAQEKN